VTPSTWRVRLLDLVEQGFDPEAAVAAQAMPIVAGSGTTVAPNVAAFLEDHCQTRHQLSVGSPNTRFSDSSCRFFQCTPNGFITDRRNDSEFHNLAGQLRLLPLIVVVAQRTWHIAHQDARETRK
jgi:hypothetical protein